MELTSFNEKVSIVVIDTGIQRNHPQLNDITYEGYNFTSTPPIKGSFNDEVGHGTAVSYIIKKYIPNSKIIMIKAFDDMHSDVSILINSLKYVHKYIHPDIINLSIGLTICENIPELKKICDQLNSSGTIIISAFDNGGVVSYPAAFDSVIGIGCSLACRKVTDYIFVENTETTILGYAGTQRLPWIDNTYQFVAGSSFVAPYITALIAQIIIKGIRDKSEILTILKEQSYCSRVYSKRVDFSYNNFIRKAIAFPYNKEIHSLANFSDLLDFELAGVYSVKGLKDVGTKMCFASKEICVDNWQNINWTGKYFDTLILGHMSRLNIISGYDYTETMLKYCLEYNKNVYAFDDISQYQNIIEEMKQKGLIVFFPRFVPEFLPQNPFGRLRKFGKPVLCVAGTSSKQGKFTLQLNIRRELLYRGYKLGQLGTEPTALLFGMDEVFPMGYNSSVSIQGDKVIEAVNLLLGKIEDKDPDLILLGLQSGTVPLSTGNMNFYPIDQAAMLFASEPDAVILCVNTFDDVEYIKRTINFIEGCISTKVIALAVAPLPNYKQNTIFGEREIIITADERRNTCKCLYDYFKIPTFCCDTNEEVKKLIDLFELFFCNND